MGASAAKGWIQVVVAGLLLLAAVLLVALQWDTHVDMKIYGADVPHANIAVLMLCSAGGGIAAVHLARMLWRGAKNLRRAKKAQEDNE